MGRYLKNTVFRSGSHALGTPSGTTSIGPDQPTNGQIRYNTSNSKLEFYNGGNWNQVAKEGNVTITKDSFTGDNSNTLFGPMSYTYQVGEEAQTLVFLNTVFQNPGVNYNFLGNTSIQFTSAPTANAAIVILHNYASTVTS